MFRYFPYLCAELFVCEMGKWKFEKISRSLSDVSRISILQKFKTKKGCVYCSEINEMLELTQPAVSHHLKQLVDADLLISEKEGRIIKYSLNPKALNDYIDFLNALKD